MIKLKAPGAWYDLADNARKTFLVAPCGPAKAARGWLAWIVPDDLLGLDIRLACGIHDFMYRHSKTKEEKIAADHLFLTNMISLILDNGQREKARLFLAVVYFLSVRFLGKAAFKG